MESEITHEEPTERLGNWENQSDTVATLLGLQYNSTNNRKKVMILSGGED